MDEDQEIPGVVEEARLPECLLYRHPCCPFPALNLFWKITIGATAVLILTFSITLWLMANATLTTNREIQALSLKVDGHKHLTMENRTITTEIRGQLNGLLGKLEQKK